MTDRADEPTVKIGGIHHISVTTGDLDRSIWFYGTVLGLPLRGRGETDSPELSVIIGLPAVKLRWGEFELGNGQILELLEYVSPLGERLEQRTSDPGSGHFALEVDDIDALHVRLERMGMPTRSAPVLIEEEGDWYGYRSLYVPDPDGFTIEFMQRPS